MISLLNYVILRSSYLALTDNQKRWLVVGIALNKILIPQIRPFVEQGINTEYNNLKISHNIHNQGPLGRLQKWPASSKKLLKYENINGNDVRLRLHGGRFNYSLFNCRVQSHMDFARLYVEKHMAKFTAFNDHRDASAVLSLQALQVMSEWKGMIGRTVSSVNGIQPNFRKVSLRWNNWSRTWHCMPSVNERELLEELKDWETKGNLFIMLIY